jgi:hypothetical protein
MGMAGGAIMKKSTRATIEKLTIAIHLTSVLIELFVVIYRNVSGA